MTPKDAVTPKNKVPGKVLFFIRRAPGFIPCSLGAVGALFILLPLAVLLLRTFAPGVFPALTTRAALTALRLSALTTALCVLLTILLGTPLAYLLARYRFPGKKLLGALLNLPMVLPPVVAGVALLLVFGRRGLLGEAFAAYGVALPFTTAAVVLVQLFVAIPFYIRALKVGFMAVPKALEGAAQVDGAGPWQVFWRITVPLVLPAFTEGVLLAWARALGEFGATLVFAGNLEGQTQTLPLAVYGALERDLDAALAMSGLLTLTAFLVFFALQYLSSEGEHREMTP